MQLLVRLATNVVFVQANIAYFALEQYALYVAGMSAFWSLEGIWVLLQKPDCIARKSAGSNNQQTVTGRLVTGRR